MMITSCHHIVRGFGLFALTLTLAASQAGAHADKPTAPPAGRLDQVNAQENNLLSGARQLTFTGAKAGEGYFSRDGRKMIYQSDRDPANPFYQIYLMDLSSGESKKLSPGQGKTTCAWLHPDDKLALFSSTHLDPDTKKKAELEIKSRNSPTRSKYSWSYDEYYDIFEVQVSDTKKLKRLTTEKGYDAEASYSPDGRLIAFASNRAAYTAPLSPEDEKFFHQDASYMMDIYIMNADGTNVRQLTTAKGYDGGPFFSADGKKITWRRFTADGQIAEIYTMNVDGSDQRPLTRLKSMSWAPYFHPTGDYVVFTTNIHGYENFELYIVDAEGKQKPVRVTFADGFDGLPVFSPDGQKISWTKRAANGDSQIFMADWNDAEARKLLALPARAPALTSLSSEIRVPDVREVVNYLASAELAGRKTGSPEEARYTEELARLFKGMGLTPGGDGQSYLQRFQFTSNVVLGKTNALRIKSGNSEKGAAAEQAFAVSQDWVPLSFSGSGEFKEAPVVFAGYGIVAPATEKATAYDSYKDLDVKGKWVVAFRDIPQNVPGPMRQHLNVYSKPQHKATVARQRGAIGLILVNGPSYPSKTSPVLLKYEGSLSGSSLAIVSVTDQVAARMLAPTGRELKALQDELDSGKPYAGFEIQDLSLGAQIDLKEEKSTGTNVVAVLKAPGKAGRTVILGAHGDHLGLGDVGNSLQTSAEKTHIHFGADDNASGVAGLLEIAHFFADPKNRVRLKQDLIFGIWSGEEIGALGSAHFTKTSLKRFSPATAYINLDMIGRLRQNLQIQGLGSAPEWRELLEQMAAKTSVAIAPQDDPYLPTDQVSFYLAGVPAISLFTGSHAEYHTPRDTPDTLNYPGTVDTIKLVADLTEKIATSARPVLTYRKVEGAKSKDLGGGRSFRIYLGTIPDYSQEGVKGVRISGVAKDSPAEIAKLTGGDVIVELDGNKIENLYDYVYALQSMRPGKAVPAIIVRSGSRVELSITPKIKE